MLRRARALEEICGSSDLPDIAICRRLWAFRLLGWIRARQTAPGSDEIDSDVRALGMIWRDESRRG
jgi:hypothetical protein